VSPNRSENVAFAAKKKAMMSFSNYALSAPSHTAAEHVRKTIGARTSPSAMLYRKTYEFLEVQSY
jgi:hypothetical protein